MNLQTTKDQVREEFNDFIEKWVPDACPHLKDTDDNAGERFRKSLDSLVDSIALEVLGMEESVLPDEDDYSYIIDVDEGREGSAESLYETLGEAEAGGFNKCIDAMKTNIRELRSSLPEKPVGL